MLPLYDYVMGLRYVIKTKYRVMITRQQ